MSIIFLRDVFNYIKLNLTYPSTFLFNFLKGGDLLKATGIVRRIDDLGRIVIPKEIRKTLRIGEGDKLEIFTDSSKQIILKKHSGISDIWNFAEDYAYCISKFLGTNIIVLDIEKVLIAMGQQKSEFLNLKISKTLESALRNKNVIKTDSFCEHFLIPSNELNGYSEFIVPIVSNGDVVGAIGAISKSSLNTNDENILRVASDFIGKHLNL